jgi:hypothetical protein
MKNCSKCKNWDKPNIAQSMSIFSITHYFCKKQRCMTCREIGIAYKADNDCFEAKEEMR